MSDPILDSVTEQYGFSPLLRTQWSFEDVAPEDGPAMTVSGTTTKLLLLLLIFTAGFLFSWHHFHAYGPHQTPVAKVQTALTEMPAWQGYFFYTQIRYPLYGWFLFFLFFVACCFTRKALVVLAPLCVGVEGISCGAFEYVLQDHYPGITLLCGAIVIGMFLGVLLVYWLGFSETENVLALSLAGAVGGLAFTYLATVVIRSFAVDVPFLHQGPTSWGWGTLGLITIGCGALANTFARISKTAKAGAPKWVEWRAALCLFASFIMLLKLFRRLVLRRSVGRLLWDFLKAAANETRAR